MTDTHTNEQTTARELARVGLIRCYLGGEPEGAWLRALPWQREFFGTHIRESLEAERSGFGDAERARTTEKADRIEAAYWTVLGRS